MACVKCLRWRIVMIAYQQASNIWVPGSAVGTTYLINRHTSPCSLWHQIVWWGYILGARHRKRTKKWKVQKQWQTQFEIWIDVYCELSYNWRLWSNDQNYSTYHNFMHDFMSLLPSPVLHPVWKIFQAGTMETLAWSYIVDASNCVLWIGYHANMEDGTQKT